MIIIHHNKDLDGFSSGAICQFKYPEAKLIGWDYSEKIPNFEPFRDEEIIMIDVSFPLPKLIELGGISKLTLIDHHIGLKRDIDKYILENVEGINFKYIYEDRVAACEIGWKYLFPNQPIPYAITLLGRYDTWRQDEGDWEGETLPFQYGVRILCTSVNTFDLDFLKSKNSSDLIETFNMGRTVLLYQEQQDMLACQRSSFVRQFNGLRALCLNTRAFSSNTMRTVYNPNDHDIMVGFEYTGNVWAVSLRSIGDSVDCSVIAKSKGGGGHKNAAGFETDNFEKIFI